MTSKDLKVEGLHQEQIWYQINRNFQNEEKFFEKEMENLFESISNIKGGVHINK